jgi:hypothetical protein
MIFMGGSQGFVLVGMIMPDEAAMAQAGSASSLPREPGSALARQSA